MKEKINIEKKPVIAILDTETNWNNRIMSIGITLANSDDFQEISSKYYILTPEYQAGGMFFDALFLQVPCPAFCCTREDAISDILGYLQKNNVNTIFAYNANFDCSLLPELSSYFWCDIMKMAAYKQYNKKLPATLEYTSTGRLRRGFGVEPMFRILSGQPYYREKHNAVFDALDELTIMRLLEIPFEGYCHACIHEGNVR